MIHYFTPDDWMKSYLDHYKGKSGYVWTEFERVKNVLVLYHLAEVVAEEVIKFDRESATFLVTKRRIYYKLKVILAIVH